MKVYAVQVMKNEVVVEQSLYRTEADAREYARECRRMCEGTCMEVVVEEVEYEN